MSNHKGRKRYDPVYEENPGRERRSEAGGREPPSRREGSRRDTPRSEPRILDGLQEISTTSNGSSSSRYGTGDRPLRESDSHNTRSHLAEDHGRGYAPAYTRDGEPKRYHSGGSNTERSRLAGSYNSIDGHEVSSSHLSQSGGSTPAHDWARGTSSSPIEESMNRMTIHEASPDDNFALHPQVGMYSSGGYVDENIVTNEPALSGSNHDDQAGSFQDKGKGIASDFSQTKMDQRDPILIRGIKGGADREQLDRSYSKRNKDYKKFFRPGRVFSTLWTEPFDDTMQKAWQSENFQFNTVVSHVSYGQKVHSKIRRFIVVRKEEDKSCTCLPVTTYGGKGHQKPGIKLIAHGLIFSGQKPPPSATGITKSPLKVNLSKGADKLRDSSYVHYGRVYTVETNVKVKDVGELDDASKKLLKSYYKAVHFTGSDDEVASQPAVPYYSGKSNAIDATDNSFRNSMADQGNDARGTYERSSGRYTQHPGWDIPAISGRIDPPSHSSNSAQPFYSGRDISSSTGTTATYRYAEVPQSGWSTTVTPGNSQQNSLQSDYRCNQESSSTGGFAATQPLGPAYAGRTYPDANWSQGHRGQPSYSPNTASFGRNEFYPSQNAGYQATSDPRYSIAASGGAYYDPHANESRGQQEQFHASASTSYQHDTNDHEIYLPTGVEAQNEAAQRRARRDSNRDRDRGGNSGYHR